MKNNISNIEFPSDLFNQGIIFNEKGDLRLNGTTWSFLGFADEATGTPGGSGFSFNFNTTINPNDGINHRYSFLGETGPPLDTTNGSWVDFGRDAGDEDFLNPARYRVRIITSSLAIPSFPVGSLVSGSQWLTGNFIDFEPELVIAHSVEYSQVNAVQYPAGRGNRYTVRIEEIGKLSNFTEIIIDLIIRGIAGNPVAPGPELPQ